MTRLRLAFVDRQVDRHGTPIRRHQVAFHQRIGQGLVDQLAGFFQRPGQFFQERFGLDIAVHFLDVGRVEQTTGSLDEGQGLEFLQHLADLQQLVAGVEFLVRHQDDDRRIGTELLEHALVGIPGGGGLGDQALRRDVVVQPFQQRRRGGRDQHQQQQHQLRVQVGQLQQILDHAGR